LSNFPESAERWTWSSTGLRDACNAMWIADCGPVRAGNNPLAASTAWRKQEGFVIPDRVSEERAEL
jgi:hypothetical protein